MKRILQNKSRLIASYHKRLITVLSAKVGIHLLCLGVQLFFHVGPGRFEPLYLLQTIGPTISELY